jgi:hypothetical protein
VIGEIKKGHINNNKGLVRISSMSRNLVFFIIFVVIFISDDSLLFGTNENSLFIAFRYILYLGILLYLNIKYGFKIDRRLLMPLILIFLSFLITMVINTDYRTGYYLEFLVVFLAAIISNRISFKDFTYYFSKIVSVLAGISIIIFSIAIISPDVIHLFPTIMNYGGVEYNSLLLCNVMKTNTLPENISVFREAGVFVIYLLFAVIIELYYNKEINIRRLLIFLIGIITASSTAGYIVLAFLLFIYILKTSNTNIKIGFSILIALFLIFFYQTLVTQVFDKLDNQSSDYRSTLSRVSSFAIPFMIFIEHFNGIGLSKFGEFYIDYSQRFFGIAFSPTGESTNTILNTFAIFGVIYGSVLIYGIYRFSRIFKSSKINIFTVFFALLMMTSTQELRFSLFFNLIVMYGFINGNLIYNPKNKNNTKSILNLV